MHVAALLNFLNSLLCNHFWTKRLDQPTKYFIALAQKPFLKSGLMDLKLGQFSDCSCLPRKSLFSQ